METFTITHSGGGGREKEKLLKPTICRKTDAYSFGTHKAQY
jgi:hypothetical protein